MTDVSEAPSRAAYGRRNERVAPSGSFDRDSWSADLWTKLTAAATVAAAGLVLVQIGRYWLHERGRRRTVKARLERISTSAKLRGDLHRVPPASRIGIAHSIAVPAGFY